MQLLPSTHTETSDYEVWAHGFMVEEETGILEAVADELWVLWAEWVIPNMVFQMREQAEVRCCKDHTKKVHKEEA